MEIEPVPAREPDRAILRRLLELYSYDVSESTVPTSTSMASSVTAISITIGPRMTGRRSSCGSMGIGLALPLYGTQLRSTWPGSSS